ncbi:MAG: tetratricopeptide repeat protein [Anaerolineae bacterium]|nr:tetratricopeptide repeat protein [Anaerolineae bacterium]
MRQKPLTPDKAPIHTFDNLPVSPPDRLFGRDQHLKAAHLALKAKTAVLLHGPAGVGKTALAAALAAKYIDTPGGVLWFDLEYDTTWSLLNRIARAYAAEVATPDEDLVEHVGMIQKLLHKYRPLLVLDGHVDIDTAYDFVQLCASGIPVLLTAPHLVDGPWTPQAVDDLSEDDAQAMLIHLAGTAAGIDRAESARLIQALGGHALSILVAGRQLASGSVRPGEFADKMPDLLPGEINRAKGALMAAYRLLPSKLPGLALLLGTAFTGGASEELLADVSGAPQTALHPAMRRLAALGFAEERNVYNQPYFAVHELVQAFAEAFLRNKNQLGIMRTRHLQGLLAYVRRHARQPSETHHDRLAVEITAIIAAGTFAVLNDQRDALQELVRLLEPITTGSFITARGFQPEFNRLERLLSPVEAAEPAIDEEYFDVQEQDTALAQPVIDIEGEEMSVPPSPIKAPGVAEFPGPSAGAETVEKAPVQPEKPASFWQIEQRTVAAEEDASGTIEQYSQALESYQADGKIDDELAALEALAALSLGQENYGDVLTYVDQGMALAQQADDPQREGHLLIILGDLQVLLGRHDGAEAAYQEAVDALLATEAWFDIGMALDKLGTFYLDQERWTDALEMLQQAVPIFERENRPDYLSMILDKLSDAHAGLLQWDKAQARHRQALQLAQASGDDRGVFEQLHKLGAVVEASGDRAAALPYYQQALYMAFQLDDIETQGQTYLDLARLLMDDTTQLNRVVQLLEAASAAWPDDTETQRLLRRAKARQERLTSAGVDLLPPEASLQAYAKPVESGSAD